MILVHVSLLEYTAKTKPCLIMKYTSLEVGSGLSQAIYKEAPYIGMRRKVCVVTYRHLNRFISLLLRSRNEWPQKDNLSQFGPWRHQFSRASLRSISLNRLQTLTMCIATLRAPLNFGSVVLSFEPRQCEWGGMYLGCYCQKVCPMMWQYCWPAILLNQLSANGITSSI